MAGMRPKVLMLNGRASRPWFPRSDASAEQSYLNPDFAPADKHTAPLNPKPIYVDEVMNRAAK